MDTLIKSPRPLSLEQILQLSDQEKAALGLAHTPSEIVQQPATWPETFDRMEHLRPSIVQFLAQGADEQAAKHLSVSLVGAGTSDYIGRAAAAAIRRNWKCHVQVIPSTDMLTEMDEIFTSAPRDTRHLWISFSRSGDSFEGVKVIESAFEKYPEVDHLIITCNKASRMANDLSAGRSNVFCITLDDKVNDRGLAMTSSFTNMIIAAQCLAHVSDLDSYRPILNALVSAAQTALPEFAELALRISQRDHSRICFLGSGPLKAVCDESALKVMELTAGDYSVMAESFLGLRHGPLSWLNDDSLVVAFVSNDPRKLPTELGLIDELKSKNIVKDIVVIGPRTVEMSAFRDACIKLDIPSEMSDNYRAPLDVIFAQCLGLFSSIRQNLKPDTPSADGKIQRVVSAINIKGLDKVN
ncbi:MAG: SIS domain-containing protein [Acidobacteria bacterium]|nr:SIS domain-containing protein [Acidobacteriota bacterium]